MPLPKLALVSHILPPSGSGQAVMLHRLLSAVPSDRYCLVSIKDYADEEAGARATERLPVPYFPLRFCRQLPIFRKFGLANVTATVNVLLTIVHRAAQIAVIVRKEGCEMLMACTGDLYDIPAAYLASRWCGIPFVPYIFDDYAYQWIGFNRELAKRFERIIMRGARAVIVPNEFMQQEYVRRHGVSSTIVRNPCHLPDLSGLDEAASHDARREISVVYTGAIYHAHYDAFRNIVTALAMLGRLDVKLHLYTAQPEDELKAQGICGPLVELHPHVPQESVPAILRDADILFLPLAFETTISEVIRTSAPGKLGEYLAAGRLILVHAPQDSFVSWYVRTHQCGIVVDKNDPTELVKELAGVLADPLAGDSFREQARVQAEIHFTVDQAQARFVGLLQSVAGDRP